MSTKLLLTLAIYRIILTVGLTLDPTELLRLGLHGQFSFDPSDVETASKDFGGLRRANPLAVLHPSSAEDIVRIVKAAFESAHGFSVSARGHGHSINGQATATNGVVIQMCSSRKPALTIVSEKFLYVDVWGGELWVDVLRSTIEYGLAPKSWTDYLYLSVGGTISNAGISGQAFNHGPQISNVYELDVITGKGELLTCSEEENSDLYHAVLGGLGQFGIITRARIALERAPQRVRWIRVLYPNFSSFTQDQEYLISLHGQPDTHKFDYVEGFVIVDEGIINNWRSSFFSSSNPLKVSSFNAEGGVLYCLEIAKNYQESNADSIDQEVEDLLKKLNFIPGSIFTTDLPYVDFLDRVHKAELKLRSKGLWDVPHPWLNIFVPKWDNKSSMVTPDEDVFYLVAFLRSALDKGTETQTLEYLTDQNHQILRFCDKEKINIKQYLPHYTSEQEWIRHFGDKWAQFSKRKMEFDPKCILATGQSIFEPSFNPNNKASRR
ncbi:unnamed protein product [Fraxinus pennsylvanica]|uniref:cytokinin dehydrogenase n=1 Tax=Fraxinus pennsylvanica TaxID=56036 RepID=A0AAD2DN68_9LAMI|nr:unnamed protein product [Fraxinus pennsylvanica]